MSLPLLGKWETISKENQIISETVGTKRLQVLKMFWFRKAALFKVLIRDEVGRGGIVRGK